MAKNYIFPNVYSSTTGLLAPPGGPNLGLGCTLPHWKEDFDIKITMEICESLKFGNVLKEGVDLTLFLSNADQPQSL